MRRLASWFAMIALAATGVQAFTPTVQAQPTAAESGFADGRGVWLQPPSTLADRPDVHLIAQPDGGALVLIGTRLFRYDARGARDSNYGYGDEGIVGDLLQGRYYLLRVGRPALLPEGSVLVPMVLASVRFGPEWFRGFAVLKLRPDGKRDESYGVLGLAHSLDRTGTGSHALAVSGIAVEPSGRIVVAGPSVNRGAPLERFGQGDGILIARFSPDGTPDESFGSGGRRSLTGPVVDAYSWFLPAPEGSFAIPYDPAPARGEVAILRFLPGGELDASFTSERLVVFPGWAAALTDRDGGILLATQSLDRDWGWVGETLARYGPEGKLVTAFGDAGSIRRFTEGPTEPWTLAPQGLAFEGDSIVVLGAFLQRLHRNGIRGLGVARGIDGEASALAISPNGDALVVAWSYLGRADDDIERWRPVLYRFPPLDDRLQGNQRVVEYFHAAFGHYFLTASADEQGHLDAGSEWRRTGYEFRSYDGTDRVGVCRLFSHAMFAPKSTHFYTHVWPECAKAQQNGWVDEGAHFAVRLLDGDFATRVCAAGTIPLFRLYNNGQGGAPNHRYTTEPAVVDQMTASGWIPEGEDARGRFACVAAP